MRFLPTRVHGVIDYLWGIALIAIPFVAGFAEAPFAKWIAIVFGAGAIAYSLVTDYEVGLVRLVPVPIHLGLDIVAGLALALAPWLIAAPDRARWTFVAFGLFAVVAGLVTRRAPAG